MAEHRREAEAEAEAGVKEKMMSKTDPHKHLATRKLQRERRARVEASSLVAHAGCAEGHISREGAPTWAKVDRRTQTPRRGPRSFSDAVQHNGTLGFPSHTKEKARESAKVKEKEEKATKEKERPSCLPWGPPLGHMPYWDENSYPSELVPPDEQGWKTVKRRKETNAPVDTPIMMKEVNSGGSTRFDVLGVTINSEEDFPVLKADVQNGAAK